MAGIENIDGRLISSSLLVYIILAAKGPLFTKLQLIQLPLASARLKYLDLGCNNVRDSVMKFYSC